MESSSKGIIGVEDRLSGLPDHLIVHILSFLPTLDAVKTMLLSRFGNLWTLVPVLSFNFDDLDSILSHRVDGSDSDSDEVDDSDLDEVFSCFTRFVRNVLMFHRNPTVDRFHLIISHVNYELEDPKIFNDLQMWLKFAIDKQVKDLNFFYDDDYHDVPIPHCIFTSQSLVKLRLRGCKLEHQPHLHVHMGSLRELSLSYVRGRDENFNQFLSGCPCLQEVEMDIFDDELHGLKVTSPSVRKLCLNLMYLVHSFTLSCPYVKRLDISVFSRHEAFMPDVVAASSLQVVNIKNLPDYLSEVKAFFRQIRNAEVFTLSSIAFQMLSPGMKTNFPQNRWKRIVLWPHFIDKESLQLILELAKSSEKLEELVIYNKFSSRNGEYRNPEFSATTTTYVMPHLKNVAIHGCGRFCDGQLLLIKLLLRNAVVLEKLIIKSRLTPPEELDFVKQVSTFKRASANATVIFA